MIYGAAGPGRAWIESERNHPMRVVVAMMSHETNTFSPVPTPLESFGPGGPYFGAAAAAAYRGTNTPMAA